MVHPSDCKVKVAFKGKYGKTVKERVPMYQDGQHKDILVALEKQLVWLGVCYSFTRKGNERSYAKLDSTL